MKKMFTLTVLVVMVVMVHAQTFENIRKYRVIAVRNSTEQTVSISNTAEIITLSSIYIPNAFSPNGDGLNDTFGAIVSGSGVASDVQTPPGVDNYSMRIFNRWGEMLFETKEINHHWDGKHKGKVVQQDVYVYQLFTVVQGNIIKKTGAVTVVL